jgi:hypothetical protein
MPPTPPTSGDIESPERVGCERCSWHGERLDCGSGRIVPCWHCRPPLSAKGEATCTNCGKRPGTHHWGDYRHSVPRCGVCTYGPQLRHALERTVAIPALSVRLLAALVKNR